MLRQFLYLDRDLVRELLGQAEGGIYEQMLQKEASTSERAGSGGVKFAFANGGASGSHAQTDATELTLQQTDASEFNRLYEFVRGEKALVELGPCDDSIWSGLRRGEILEIEANLAPTGMSNLRDLVAVGQNFAQFADLIGQSVDPAVAKNMSLMAAFASSPEDRVTVVAEMADEPRFKFRCRLGRANLRCGPDELAGEAVVFGKLGRKLQPGQSLDLEDILGGAQKFVTEKKKRELQRGLGRTKVGDSTLGAMSLRYPAADLTALAIYR